MSINVWLSEAIALTLAIRVYLFYHSDVTHDPTCLLNLSKVLHKIAAGGKMNCLGTLTFYERAK